MVKVNLKYFKNLNMWPIKPLEKILEEESSGIWGKQDNVNGKPILRSTNFKDDGYLDFSDEILINIPKKDSLKKQLKKGDILLERSGGGPNKPVGRVAYYENEGPHYYGNFIQVLRTNENIMYSKYLFYILYYIYHLGITNIIQNQTTGIRNLDYKSYLKLDAPVPPIVEQRGIAELLGTVDEAIRLTDRVIERTEALKRGLMQRLLTQGIGHTEFKDTPLGRIPKTWKVGSIGEEFEVGTGGTPRRSNPEYYNGTIPWVKSTEINQDLITYTEEHLTNKGIVNSNASVYPSGTLLIAMYGQGTTRGKSALLGIDASINQALAAMVKKSNKVSTKFLKYWLDFNYDKNRSLGQGANQSNLNLQIIKTIKLPIPPMDEQKRIVNIIGNQDNIIRNEKGTKSLLLKVKHSLMQILLSGERRVKLREDGLHRINNSGACL